MLFFVGTELPAGQKSFTSDSYNSSHKIMSGNPEKHNELSRNTKCEADSTQKKECTSINESLTSQGSKCLPLVNSPPSPAVEQKCEATENDETVQIKEKFKKINFGNVI